MRQTVRITYTIACAAVCALTLSAGATSAYATPGTTLEQLKAEEASLTAALEQTRVDLAIEVAEYIETGKLIERSKAEIAQATIDLAAAEVKQEETDAALRRRAVELYRGDRMELLSMLFTAQTLQDLWVRANYLTKITSRDATLLSDVRLARSEAMWLKGSLIAKMDRLHELQRDADARRERIEDELEEQEKRAEQLRVDIARVMWSPGEAGRAPSGGFDPSAIISQAAFRDSGSMTVEQIQAFLEEQPGSLARYKAADRNGVMKPASQLIGEAAVAHGINPKVLLVKLQKEQSLLERPNPTQRAYDWALGVGKTDSRTISKYRGFGMQVWSAAQVLDKHDRIGATRPGVTMPIDGSVVVPQNPATYALYKYTPHFRGNMSFWMLYWRYFGDPTL